MPTGQQRCAGQGLRADPHRGAHRGHHLGALIASLIPAGSGDLPAARAGLRHPLILGDFRCRRRAYVHHLTPLPTRLHGLGQRLGAPPAARRLDHHHPIRILDQRPRRRRRPRLLARVAPRAGPRRTPLRPRLVPRCIRGRGPRGVRRIRPQPALQLRDPIRLLTDDPLLPGHPRPELTHQRQQLLIGQGVVRHRASLPEPQKRSSRHADPGHTRPTNHTSTS